ncbi:hypothetical protein ACFSTD_11080 [Novosphingobium colocasiae]
MPLSLDPNRTAVALMAVLSCLPIVILTLAADRRIARMIPVTLVGFGLFSAVLGGQGSLRAATRAWCCSRAVSCGISFMPLSPITTLLGCFFRHLPRRSRRNQARLVGGALARRPSAAAGDLADTLARNVPAIKLVLGALFALCTVLTQSRSSVLVLAAVLVWLGFRSRHAAIGLVRRSLAGGPGRVWLVAGLLGLAAVGAVTVSGSRGVRDSFARFERMDDPRFAIWADVHATIDRYMPIGAGLGAFDEVFPLDEIAGDNLDPHRGTRAQRLSGGDGGIRCGRPAADPRLGDLDRAAGVAGEGRAQRPADNNGVCRDGLFRAAIGGRLSVAQHGDARHRRLHGRAAGTAVPSRRSYRRQCVRGRGMTPALRSGLWWSMAILLACCAALLQLDLWTQTRPTLARLVPAPFQSRAATFSANQAIEQGDWTKARALSIRALRHRPIPASSLSALALARSQAGTIADETAWAALAEAAARGWRDGAAQTGALAMAMEVGRYDVAAMRMDALWRTRIATSGAEPILTAAFAEPRLRAELAKRYAAGVPWASDFFELGRGQCAARSTG